MNRAGTVCTGLGTSDPVPTVHPAAPTRRYEPQEPSCPAVSPPGGEVTPPEPDATLPAATAPSEEAGHPGLALSRREHEMLAFERQWWRHAGAKETAIRERFGLAPTRYYQALNALVENPAALAADPLLVRRLRRLRAARGSVVRRTCWEMTTVLSSLTTVGRHDAPGGDGKDRGNPSVPLNRRRTDALAPAPADLPEDPGDHPTAPKPRRAPARGAARGRDRPGSPPAARPSVLRSTGSRPAARG